MQFTRNFAIRSFGLVRGGKAQYSADTVTGDLVYQAQVTVGRWPFTKTVSSQGVYKVDPKLLLSEEVETVGNRVTLGPVSLAVTEVDPDEQSTVAIQIQGQPWVGTAYLDVTGIVWRLNKLIAHVQVPVLGTLYIEADYDDSPKSFFQLFSRWRH